MKDTTGKNQDDSIEPIRHTSDISPKHKKPLTPTKNHPLMDLERKESNKSEFMDDSDDADNNVILNQLETTNSLGISSSQMIFNKSNEIPSELDNYQATTIVKANNDDSNNNSTIQETTTESDNEMIKENFSSDSITKRKKSPSRTNNNSANITNNNQMSSSLVSQELNEDEVSKITGMP